MKSKKLFKRIVGTLALCSVIASVGAPINAEAAAKNKVNKVDMTYVKQVFDAQYYYDTYPDVAAAFGNNEEKLLNHYITYGITENRNASATFNAGIYKDNYVDLKNAFGSNMFSYCRHYCEYGLAEGRNAIDALNPAPAGQVVPGELIATYTTLFDNKIARATNVKLAASQVNGKILEPGETFSFLGSITPRTIANGYVVAPVFSNKKVSKGVGGGICQVSSTIYAAVLNTSCTIVERHAHSLPVSYVPKGMDATVSSPSLDFRFTNTYEYPLLFTITAEEGVLTVNISAQK